MDTKRLIFKVFIFSVLTYLKVSSPYFLLYLPCDLELPFRLNDKYFYRIKWVNYKLVKNLNVYFTFFSFWVLILSQLFYLFSFFSYLRHYPYLLHLHLRQLVRLHLHLHRLVLRHLVVLHLHPHFLHLRLPLLRQLFFHRHLHRRRHFSISSFYLCLSFSISFRLLI